MLTSRNESDYSALALATAPGAGEVEVNFDLADEVIERAANQVRERLGMDYVFALDMENVLSRLPKKAPKFSVREDLLRELEDAEAFMDCENHQMVLSREVFRALKTADPRARFTVAHELGHYFLGHSGNTKRSSRKSTYLTPRQKIQEIQADKFASYLLVPTTMAAKLVTVREIVEKFQVSIQAAEIALERIDTAKRKEKGEARPSPASVVDFLKVAAKQGYRVKSIPNLNFDE